MPETLSLRSELATPKAPPTFPAGKPKPTRTPSSTLPYGAASPAGLSVGGSSRSCAYAGAPKSETPTARTDSPTSFHIGLHRINDRSPSAIGRGHRPPPPRLH